LDPDGTLDAMLATGATPGEAMGRIGAVDPRAARKLLRDRWKEFVRFGEILDLSGQAWVRSLPGTYMDVCARIDLTGCVNFRSLPEGFMMDDSAELVLDGTGWDEVTPYPQNMDKDAEIRFNGMVYCRF
jgi:hypothetical protein